VYYINVKAIARVLLLLLVSFILSAEESTEEVKIPFLTMEDFSTPPPEEISLFDEYLPGRHPVGGTVAGSILVLSGIGATAGSLYYTLEDLTSDPSGNEMYQGLSYTGVSMIGLGLSCLILDFYLDKLTSKE